MKAGTLRERVQIQARSLATADTYGSQAEVWSTTFADVPAEIIQLSAVEHWKQKAAMPEATHQVVVRYNADLKAACRFKWGSRYLYPSSIVVDQKLTKQTCLCGEQLTG